MRSGACRVEGVPDSGDTCDTRGSLDSIEVPGVSGPFGPNDSSASTAVTDSEDSPSVRGVLVTCGCADSLGAIEVKGARTVRAIDDTRRVKDSSGVPASGGVADSTPGVQWVGPGSGHLDQAHRSQEAEVTGGPDGRRWSARMTPVESQTLLESLHPNPESGTAAQFGGVGGGGSRRRVPSLNRMWSAWLGIGRWC